MATMSTHRIASAIANHLKKNGLNAEIEHSRRSNSKYVYASIPEDHYWDHWDEMEKQSLKPDKMKTIRISDHLNPAMRFGRQSDSNDRAIETDYEIRTDQDNQKNWKDIAHATVSDFSPEMSFLQGKGQIPHKSNGGDVDGITAYHGSPHDFEQFDTSKIGTGEGAQAYGHGLYFAENEPTAKHYRDMLSAQGSPIVSARVKQAIKDAGGDESAAQNYIKQAIAHHENTKNKSGAQFWKTALDQFDTLKKDAGHMYEVHINAHPHHMLDWDKPLSEQPSYITKSLFDVRKELPTVWEKTQHHINNDSTAGDFYQSIAAGHPHGYAGATEQLSRAGIKGIKYQDAGSRGAGQYDLHVMYKGKPHSDPIPMMDKAQAEHHAKEYQAKGYDTEVKPRGTHNYVVFDHNDVRVKRKYERGGTVNGYEGGGDVGHRVHFPSLSAVYD